MQRSKRSNRLLMRLKRVALLVLVLGVGLALLGAAFYTWWPRETPAGQPPLARLEPDSLAAFRDRFNGASSSHRLVVMLSPT